MSEYDREGGERHHPDAMAGNEIGDDRTSTTTARDEMVLPPAPPNQDGTSEQQADPSSTASGDSDELPLEYQCEEVDLTDPDMDPLEWTVRRFVPIPRQYFWETGNYDLPLRIKTWHRTVAVLGRIVRLFERGGEVAANITGLNSTRFDYVTDTMTEEEWDAARRTARERKERREEAQAKAESDLAAGEAAGDIGVAPDVI